METVGIIGLLVPIVAWAASLVLSLLTVHRMDEAKRRQDEADDLMRRMMSRRP